MALVLAIGGMLAGSVFIPHSSSGIQETAAFTESVIIPQAQGAEVDSAALAVTSAPFVASVNSGANAGSGVNADALYAEGAVKDPEQFAKNTTTHTFAAASESGKNALAYGIIYQVAAGDTLASIAEKFNVTEDRITQFNPSVNFSALVQGISIIIPGKYDVNAFTVQS